MLGTGAIEAVAFLFDGYVLHHRQLGIDFTRRQDRLVQLLEVAECLQNNEIDAFFVQARNLRPKSLARLGKSDLAQRLNADAERADSPSDHGIEAFSGLAGQTDASSVDLGQFIHTTMFRQPKRISAEGVSFYELSPGLEVFGVDAANQVGL